MSLQTLLSVQNTDIEQSWLLTPPASLSPVSSPYLSLSPAMSLLTGDSHQVTWDFHPSNIKAKPGVMAHVCNPSALEAKKKDWEFKASLDYIMGFWPA